MTNLLILLGASLASALLCLFINIQSSNNNLPALVLRVSSFVSLLGSLFIAATALLRIASLAL